MLYDSQQERDSLRRELNIVISQLIDCQSDYQRLAKSYKRLADAIYCPDCKAADNAK